MKKRLCSLLLALALCLGLTLPAAADGPSFTDVPADHWAYAAVEDMVRRGVTTGMGDGLFAPDGQVTYAQFSTMLVRALYAQALEEAASPVAHWWGAAASVAEEEGLLDHTAFGESYTGSGWDAALADTPIRRYDMAMVMYNLLGRSGLALPDEETLAAARERIGDWDATAQQREPYPLAVATVYALGCLTGLDDAGTFGGEAQMNRAQACVVIQRLLAAIEASPQTPAAEEAPPETSEVPETPETSQPEETPQPEESPQPEDTQQPEATPQPEETPQPEQTEDTDTADPQAFVEEVLRLVNEERAKENLDPLTLDDKACQAAAVRAQEIVTNVSHTRPDGRDCFTALEEAGVDWQATGENIAAGQRSPEEVVTGWMNSPGHRANILNDNFTHIGIGYCYAEDSYYGHYWVQMFVG